MSEAAEDVPTALEVRIVVHPGLAPGGAAGGARTVRVRRGTALAVVLADLGVDPGLVGVASSAGRLVALASPLDEECTVDVYPLVGGG